MDYQLMLRSDNLQLILKSPQEVREFIDGLSPAERGELSAEWLSLVDSAMSADPWVHGFDVKTLREDIVVGQCGFKGPPNSNGVVEIAYGINEEHQGQGYATEAARALTEFALRDDQVKVVRAHTLPMTNASTSVLSKCGFEKIGEYDDPDDGLVWRWETEAPRK